MCRTSKRRNFCPTNKYQLVSTIVGIVLMAAIGMMVAHATNVVVLFNHVR